MSVGVTPFTNKNNENDGQTTGEGAHTVPEVYEVTGELMIRSERDADADKPDVNTDDKLSTSYEPMGECSPISGQYRITTRYYNSTYRQGIHSMLSQQQGTSSNTVKKQRATGKFIHATRRKLNVTI